MIAYSPAKILGDSIQTHLDYLGGGSLLFFSYINILIKTGLSLISNYITILFSGCK